MAILSTTISIGTPQADGRCWVTERHIDHTCREHRCEYLAPPEWDHDEVAQLRAANISAELDRREAQSREAANYVIALTKREFLDRFTPQERIAIRQAAKTDLIVEDFLDYLDKSADILPGFPALLQGLGYFEQLGVLAAGRAAEIGGA